jgi:outer membrane biosynthesis protein TonB
VRTSIILSVLLHIVVLTAVLLNFRSSTRVEVNDQRVAVELVAPSDLTQVKAGKKNAPDQDASNAPPPLEKKPESAPKAPEPKPAEKPAEKQATPPPPKAEPVKTAEAEPKPEPKPEPPAAKPEPKREEAKPEKPKPEKQAEAKPKKPDPKPKPEPKPEAKSKPNPTPFRDKIADLLKDPAEEQPKSQPAPPSQTKREFDADRIAALLNRDPKAGDMAAQQGPKEPWHKPSSLQDQLAGLDQHVAPPRETLGAPGGQDARMSASEIDYFRQQISRCWTPPVGGLGGEEIVVKLHIELKQDGTLVRAPELANSSSSPFFTAAADAAMRAVFQCQPYTMPAEKFSLWHDMLLNFDPRRMYGG